MSEETKFVPRSPDFRVKVRKRDNHAIEQYIGAAWIEKSGAISVVIDPFVVVDGRDNLQITLFPNDRSKKEAK